MNNGNTSNSTNNGNQNNIRFVLFDWGGTLGRSGQRQIFLDSTKPMHIRCSTLQNTTVATLRCIQYMKIPMGILSNTAVLKQDMDRALKETGLDKYFNLGLYSSDPGLCSKPCSGIFQKAIFIIQQMIPGIQPQEILYVGDNYVSDVFGAKSLGMKTAYIVNGNHYKEIAVKQLGFQTYTLNELSDLCDILLAA